jgi:two-component system nitrate/nitrite response regulator NarL
MVRRITTIIVEPHLLMREGLASLISDFSYRVVGSVACAADINHPAITCDSQTLVILGAKALDRALSEAACIRKVWPQTKIVLLFDDLSSADLQNLFESEFDACVPMFVSGDFLVRMLDLVMLDDARILVLTAAQRPFIDLGITGEYHPEQKENGTQSANGAPSKASVCSIVPNGDHGNGTSRSGVHYGPLRVSRPRSRPRLSDRETQILDGLVKGYANKVIARTCDITEATVKVHMKSILRKIQVANRTQAAIWALENGYVVDEVNHQLLQAQRS